MDKKIDPEILEKIKDRFMEYDSVTAICKDFNVPRTTIQNYVNNSWKTERELARHELFNDLAKSKKSQFVKLTQSAILVLARALDNVAKQEAAPSIKEARDVAAVMEALDKITRLDDSKPTEIIHQEKVLDVTELRQKLLVDPFMVLTDKETSDDTIN